ncbi:exostosin family protein [Tripterygium wilfordii]|uniref:3-hydroxyisobutyryl-CoA hydrolase n=1 Tax=Tripterygium wilfordii TaxID=458696 RepID=A0A7J7CFR1_TRIWF|nr:exostosin family protein [Tripterygium wilfordii]
MKRSLIRRCFQTCRSLSEYRNFASHPNCAVLDDLDSQVLVEGRAYSRTAILNRPSALNALNTNMGARLLKLYRSWEEDPDIGFVALKGSGRAFCAGGDIVSIFVLMNEGRVEDCKEFFRTLYTFIYLLGTYLKPHVSLLNGITMGGGAGVSIPGTFKVATNKTVFATPETLIGFHPDAGASFYLSHLPGHLGEYLALTGEKLDGAEMIACGLATHYSHITKLQLIEEQLAQLVTDDPSSVESSLEKYGDLVHADKMSVLHRIETVDKCFGLDTIEEIIDVLEIEASRTNDPWCTSTLRRLKEASPLSLKVSLRSIREGRFQTLDQCLVREYRMSLQGISKKITNDFCEVQNLSTLHYLN